VNSVPWFPGERDVTWDCGRGESRAEKTWGEEPFARSVSSGKVEASLQNYTEGCLRIASELFLK
jgi:hypothetical protein